MAAFAAGALAAAFISPGGVGAEFVAAAKASASITVTDNPGVPSEPLCRIILHHTGRTFDFGDHGGHDPFDIWQLGKDRGDGTFGATLDFTISAPGAEWIDVDWKVSTAGDLHYFPPTDMHSPSGSVTFWWQTPRSSHHMKGKAFITFNCTPHYNKHHKGHGNGQGPMSLTSLDGVDSLESAGSGSEPDVSSAADISDAPETYSVEAIIDVPAEDQSDQSCDTSTTTLAALETTPSAVTQDGCARSGQPEIDCAPSSADSSGAATCAPTDDAADLSTGSPSTAAQDSTSSSPSDSDGTNTEDDSSDTTESQPADRPKADPLPHGN